MKTLIIDNFDSFTYNLSQYVAELGGNPEVFRNNEITLPEIEAKKYTHIIISPGPGTPEKKEDFGICSEVIQILATKTPILGVCLGHQGIISTLGGKIIRAPFPVHGKRNLIHIKNHHPLFRGLPEKIEGMRYHSLIGERKNIPKELDIIAETDDGLIMAIAHKKYPLYGVQFHPESIGTPYGKEILKNFLYEPHDLENEAETFIDRIAEDTISEQEITDKLTEIAQRGETVEEIIGMTRGLKKHMIKIPIKGKLMDTCGTGGSGLKRMNISTLNAFILAACGIKVAKHGNRAVSGSCGSFDLLEKLGMPPLQSPEAITESLQKFNLAFIFAPNFHPVMKKISPIRKKLPFQTIFNILGPLINPSEPKYHLLGTISKDIAKKLIEAMKQLHYRHALVVVGENGLDEIVGKTSLYELKNDEAHHYQYDAQKNTTEHIGTPEENVRLFLELIQGKGPKELTDLVILNAAFGLKVAEKVKSIEEGKKIAHEALKTGAVQEKFLKLKACTQKFS